MIPGAAAAALAAAAAPEPEPPAPRSEVLENLEARLQAQADELRRLREENEALRASGLTQEEETEFPDDEDEEDLNADLSFEDEDDEGSGDDSFSREAEDGALFDLLLEDDDDSDLDADFFSDDEDDEDEDENDEDEDQDEDDEDLDEDLDDDEDDILSSFFSFSNELKTMTVFEKMRFDGRTTETISFETLEGLVQAQRERRRQERLNANADQV